MKKHIVGYVVVFVLGFAACALILYTLGMVVGKSGPIVLINGPHGSNLLARGGSNQVAIAAAKIEESVVNIDTIGRPVTTGFSDFFGFGSPQELTPKGQASGVIIRSEGYILTNNHVVADTSKVQVTLWNGKKYMATIIGRDPKTDLAVIKIPVAGLPAAIPAQSSNLQVGDWVIAVGNSLGLGTTVTVGVISATERGLEGTTLENALQTDAAINRGNSGGALADINGNLIGINTAIASTNPGGGSIGIGFAIPSNTAVSVANQLIKKGKVIRPWLGIMYIVVTDDNRKELIAEGQNAPPLNGAWVKDVIPSSPAKNAGIMKDDAILKINGQKVIDQRTIAHVIDKTKVGQIVNLTVWQARTGKTVKITVRTGEMPSDL